ncbi:dTDP-4-dehydrorhamnose 3,5-epimerase [Sulfitobacter sp. SK012]|uniref:dTDP-4-dehydrorhamnose 3,5-epimerase family protein n=1 Tax=Sulfitobacter sp. SK012 TaxID=1389005 RepID=UPI000E0AC8E1|nr:dTDP-4-dehydrorhamnose 3,5-epimerase family protein [Sulfitobacter sp. SK012]AXI48171.1 dTDP-4-dehydrorhamnose 3,5-epimerase [Sulfitobacter sp. SK012]
MAGRFTFHETALAGVIEVRRHRLGDDRGYLERMFCKDDLAQAGWLGEVAQANRTLTSTFGTLRGMHYQRAPFSEVKLVTCLAGQVYDVAVDLREGSKTFGQHTACLLDATIGNALLIPEGFAHGFQTLTDNCEMFYFHSRPYAQKHESGIDAFDPILNIRWPLKQGQQSSRDRDLPPLDKADLPGVPMI